jgi:hypothetical protein
MQPGGSAFQNELYSNIPSMAMMMTMYTTTFGNGAFVIQPASQGEVQDGFPTIPYLPLEAMIYQQQSSNPVVAPTNINTGSTAGTQNLQGTQTVTDQTGNIRVALGNTTTV